MKESDRLAELKKAADILGALPGGGTQDAEYLAYKIVSDEIERVEQKLTEAKGA